MVNSVYARLEAAGQRLLAIIRNGKGMANKDMGKFADQINALCDKWQYGTVGDSNKLSVTVPEKKNRREKAI